MKQFLFVVTSLLVLSSAAYGQSKWWVSSDSVNIFTRNTGGVMIGGVEPLGKLTVNGDRLGFNLALVGDYNNLSKNYLKIGVLGRASNGLDGHTLFDLYHSNGSQKKAGFNFRINEKSAFFINGEGNIGIGTEKPMAGLDITSGPDWGGFKKGLRLSTNNAISVESGEMKYGMVGSENALHFFATNGGEKVNPFGSAFAKLMSLQPKKVVIEGDLEVKGKIIYEGGQFQGGGTNTGSSNTGGSSAGTGTADDGGKSDGAIGGGSFVETLGSILWYGNDPGNINYNNGNVGIGTTSPGAKLSINGSGDLFKIESPSSNYFKYYSIDDNKYFTHSKTNVYFQNEGNYNQVLHLRPLGITTSSPGQWGSTLSMYYTERTSDIEKKGNSGTKEGSGYATEIAYVTNYYEKIRLNSNGSSYLNGGNVGIGTETPINWANLDIYNSQNTAFIRVKGIGNVSNYSGINLSSDEATDKEWEIVHRNTNGSFNQKNFLSFAYYNGTVWNEMMGISPSGNVGIGTRNPGDNKLAVNGTIKAKELYLTIDAGQWSDFVFDKNYKLRSLKEVDQFIKQNKHLPDMASEKELLDKGVGVVDMQAKLLQKIEELTLYMIQKDKEIQELKEKVTELENKK